MNKIKEKFSNELKDYKSTLKLTSYDKVHQEYLCRDNQLEVFNFDKYIDNVVYRGQDNPHSPDAIYLGINKIYFIEFKNSPYSNIKEKKIKKKFLNGVNEIKKILHNCNYEHINFIFCVVYKNQKKSPYFNPSSIESNIVKFGLNTENKKLDNFYNYIITQDVNYYKDNFKQLKC